MLWITSCCIYPLEYRLNVFKAFAYYDILVLSFNQLKFSRVQSILSQQSIKQHAITLATRYDLPNTKPPKIFKLQVYLSQNQAQNAIKTKKNK